MPKIIPHDTVRKAIILRTKKRLSIDEIRQATGISQGTLSVLLRPYPLTPEEISARCSENATKGNLLRNGRPKLKFKYDKIVPATAK